MKKPVKVQKKNRYSWEKPTQKMKVTFSMENNLQKFWKQPVIVKTKPVKTKKGPCNISNKP